MPDKTGEGDQGVGDLPIRRDTSSIRLTVLDLMAAFVPGAVWMLVLAASWHLTDADPLSAALSTLGVPAKDAIALVPTLLGAFIVGYAVKPIVMTLAGRLSCERSFVRREARRKGAATRNPDDLRFPYRALYGDKPYYAVLIGRLEQQLGSAGFTVADLPRYPPFSVCKRLIRIMRPELWEELEHREAEVRMLASLFLAASTSTVASIVAVCIEATDPGRWRWLCLSVIAAVVLSVGFRVSRRREVEYAYLAYLITPAVSTRMRG